MCLAVPGKIIHIDESTPELRMAKVDFGGMIKDICIQWVDAGIGDYILAHAGLAISTVNEELAIQTLDDFETLAKYIENPEN
jgi:hydrogenase expression/formation protein HypC